MLQPFVLEVKISLTYLMNTKHDHSGWRVRRHISTLRHRLTLSPCNLARALEMLNAKNRTISARINTNVIRSMGLCEEVQGIWPPLSYQSIC